MFISLPLRHWWEYSIISGWERSRVLVWFSFQLVCPIVYLLYPYCTDPSLFYSDLNAPPSEISVKSTKTFWPLHLKFGFPPTIWLKKLKPIKKLKQLYVQVICPFFNWVVCLPGVQSCKFFIYFGDQALVWGWWECRLVRPLWKTVWNFHQPVH